MGANTLIIVDEFAYVDVRVLSVILMTLTVASVGMVGISTRRETMSASWNTMATATNRHGAPLFAFLRVKGACDACFARGAANACLHVPRPPWLNSEADEAIIAMVPDKQFIEQELRGGSTSSMRAAFHPGRLTEMSVFNETRLALAEHEYPRPPVFFIGIDPAGQGRSNYCAVALCRVADRYAILGLGQMRSGDSRDQVQMVANMVNGVRRIVGMAHAQCYILIERNMSHAADMLVLLLPAHKLRSCAIVYIGAPPATPGMVTTWSTKTTMTELVAITIDQMHLRPVAPMGAYGSAPGDVPALWAEYVRQLRAFAHISEPGHKTVVRGSGGDDLVMATLMAFECYARYAAYPALFTPGSAPVTVPPR